MDEVVLGGTGLSNTSKYPLPIEQKHNFTTEEWKAKRGEAIMGIEYSIFLSN